MALDLLGLKSMLGGQVSEEVRKKRIDHCKGCTFLTKATRCMKCGCFMNVKVRFKEAFCPIGIWGKDGK